MTCTACGTLNAEGAKFCSECGEPLSQACPTCGSSVTAGAKFCSECGAPFAANTEPRSATTVQLAYEFKGLICEVATTKANNANGELILKGFSPTILLEDGVGYASFNNKTLSDIFNKASANFEQSECRVNVNPSVNLLSLQRTDGAIKKVFTNTRSNVVGA